MDRLAISSATPKLIHPATKINQRILIIHQNFPGQFRHIAQHLLTQPHIQVIGLGRDTAPGLPDFPWYRYTLHRQPHTQTHHYLRQMESAVLHGQAVVRALMELQRKGFTPDIILAHPGWGETLYVKDIFPQAKLIHYCEWYYHTQGADFGFDPEFPLTLDDHMRIQTWNAQHLLNLQNCDAGISPTHWQKSQFPAEYQNKIQVIHEGIDTDNLGPDPNATLTLPNGQTLKAGQPIVTYVARNLEPYRGFHIFMRALPQLLKEHPTAQIVIVGGDNVSYGKAPQGAKNWREKMLKEIKPKLGDNQPRIHFLGKVPYDQYKKTLQVSAVHVYFTYPFVLSWSMLEAMASGCLIVASDTAPVREVIKDGENVVMTEFFEVKALSEKLKFALETRNETQEMRKRITNRIKNGLFQRNEGVIQTTHYLNEVLIKNGDK